MVAVVLERLFGAVLPWDAEQIRALLDATGPLASFVYVAAVVTAVVVPPLPSVPLDLAAGLAFGVWWGTLLTVAGDLIGAAIAFALARRLGRPWLEGRVARGSPSSLEELARALTPRRLVGVRLLPTFSFELVSYAAGLSTMSLPSFLAATLVGVAAPVVALVSLGDALLTHRIAALSIFGALLLLTVVPLAWWSWGPRGVPGEHSVTSITAPSRAGLLD